MLICATRLSRKKIALAVILAGIALSVLILLVGREPPAEVLSQPQLCSNEDRLEYLRSMGWEVTAEPLETLQFLLPPRLSGDYLAYNELQMSQGFDLSICCGKQVTRYTYAVQNYPGRPDGVQLNLYVCEDFAVAGDILCAGANGFQAALKYPA